MVTEDPIDITWNDRKLEKACASDRGGKREFGQDRWTRLKARLAVLEAAPALTDVKNTPGKWHPLSADRAGQWAASLDANSRLIIEPDHDPLPILAHGGLDVAAVTSVKIVEVVDYHGR